MLLNLRPARQIGAASYSVRFSFVLGVSLTAYGVNSYADSETSVSVVTENRKSKLKKMGSQTITQYDNRRKKSAK